MSGLTRRLRRCAGLSALVLFAACESSTEPDPVVPLTRDSEHFAFESNTALATPAEMDDGIQRAEAHYTAIAVLVGPDWLPNRKITVILEGDKIPNRAGAYVDEDGAIRLSRYRADLGGYFGPLAHELTHAVRYEYWVAYQVAQWENFMYLEEGFAEFVALRVDPDKLGFPFYGYDPDVITGERMIRGEGIPQPVMRARHDLNTPCQWQTYPLRTSWFRYLEETYGLEVVLALAYAEAETTNEMIEARLGAPLEQVDAAWEQWQLARYAAIPGAHEMAAPYFVKFANENICVAGVDY